VSAEERTPAVLVSLRPRFADAILQGRKSVELRRRRVAAPAGSLLVLYAAAPVMAVLGTALLVRTDVAAAPAIWRRHRSLLGLSKDEFDAYVDGAPLVSALMLTRPSALDRPLTLAALRADRPFQPPQSYRYVCDTDPAPLRALCVVPATPAALAG
jgi:predicted transcriptional regulator